jgi:hypothetical protein
MSSSALKLLAASGAKGSATYVDDVFSTYVYEGTQATLAINNGIDLSGEGGLTWFKCRNVGMLHNLFDTVRGNTQRLDSSGSGAQSAQAAGRYPTFTSTGFTLGADDGGDINYSGREYVSWSFRKQPGFFDIVTYTGNGATSRDISHNLETAPGVIIIKRTDDASDWTFQHRYNGNYVQYLNDTAVRSDSGATLQFNSTSFKVVGPPSGLADAKCTNVNGATYVAYLFAHDAQDFGTDSDESIIKCGSYEGTNSNHDVDLGFEPQWVLVKNIDAAGNWEIYDVMRGMPSGTNARYIRADSSAAENGTVEFYPTSSGFTVTGSNTNTNSNGHTFIYVAIRRPHKPASEFAATDLFAVDNNTTSTSAGYPNFVSGFPVDMGLANTVDETGYTSLSSRLTGKQMYTPARDAEEGSPEYDYSTGFKEGGSSTNADEYGWMWRRAPGFFDVVAYKGTGSAVWHNHNLGVVPEMIICKGRNIAEYWNVFTTGGGTSSRLHLDEGNEYLTNNAGQYFPSLPTTTQFRIGQNSEIGGSGYNYIAYLFASLDGISKLGTYTGTGSAQNIDCGFSAGARFVLIKRVDVAGYWMVWDSVRGIVAGNDPYLVLNTTAAHITNTDYIDPLASGFTITSSAPTDNSDYSMNKSSGTYFFYAIA